MTKRFSLLLLTLALVPRLAAAQIDTHGDSVHSSRTLFTWRDGVLAAGFTGLTFAMFPADRSFAQRLQNPRTQTNKFFEHASSGIEYIVQPGSIIIGVSLYSVGRVGHWHNMQDLGLHGTEAIVIASGMTTVIKGLAGRARPSVVHDTIPDDFKFTRGFRGGGDYASFPSGHTTAAFAAASVVTSESQRWCRKCVWVVAPAMYGGATLVGLSRMYHNRHWASDVALGAAIGTFTGIKVVRFQHGHTDNLIDRVLNHAEVMPAPNGDTGVGLAFSP
jgi:membrane-associated phospholipid phosphatase